MIIKVTDDRIQYNNLEASFSFNDFVNPESIDRDERKQKAYVFLDGGFIVAIVLSEYPAYSLEDAIDTAVDAGKFDRFQIKQEELSDYSEEEDRISYLGNASEPFDIETLDVWEFPAEFFLDLTPMMRPDRVERRLDDALSKAQYQLDQTDTKSPLWTSRYEVKKALEDANTLFRLMQHR